MNQRMPAYIRNYRPNEPYIKPLAHRDRQAIMQELNRLIEEGTLTEEHWQFRAKSKLTITCKTKGASIGF
jgi:hypothetical protein